VSPSITRVTKKVDGSLGGSVEGAGAGVVCVLLSSKVVGGEGWLTNNA